MDLLYLLQCKREGGGEKREFEREGAMLHEGVIHERECVHVREREREGGREHEEVIHERGREEVKAWGTLTWMDVSGS